MRLVRYGVVAVLALGLLVTSVGWYLATHPGGTRFESCHWQGDQLVLEPHTAGVVAQLRVDEGGGDHVTGALSGEARFSLTGGTRPVHYPNGAELNCPVR